MYVSTIHTNTLHTVDSWTAKGSRERQTRHTFLLLQIIVEYMLTHANSVDASDSRPKINSLLEILIKCVNKNLEMQHYGVNEFKRRIFLPR